MEGGWRVQGGVCSCKSYGTFYTKMGLVDFIL